MEPVKKQPRLAERPTTPCTENDEFFGIFPLGRKECEYKTKCYRRNSQHLKDYRHTELESLFMRMRKEGDSFVTQETLSEFPDKDAVYEQLKVLCELRKEVAGTLDENSSSKMTTASTSSASSSSGANANSPSPRPKCPTDSPNNGPRRGILEKWEASCPFNFFLTKIPSENSSAALSVSFQDLFHPSLGKIKAVCHFNYMVESDWFIEQTLEAKLDDTEVKVIYGVQSEELESSTQIFPWLKVHLIKSPFPYGHHHTKMMLIKYTDNSLRFIVCTANLIDSDWDNRTQGVWISPRCPPIVPEEGEHLSQTIGESESNFRFDLLQYLTSYPAKYIGDWRKDIESCDCSDIRVVFVGSVPVTSMSSITGFNFGIKKMEKILKNSSWTGPDWPLLMQCSSIGTLGPTDDWLRNEVGASMKSTEQNVFPISLIYPSVSNVKESFDGIQGGGCLPYSHNTHAKQTWIQNMLFQWKSNSRQRTRAMPHIKSYCRISPDKTKIAWFHLTSANLSKAAWGKLNKARDKLTMMSWEAGVLFIPKYIGQPGQQSFPISAHPSAGDKSGQGFPLPFDIPLTKFNSNDSPWFMDILLEENSKMH